VLQGQEGEAAGGGGVRDMLDHKDTTTKEVCVCDDVCFHEDGYQECCRVRKVRRGAGGGGRG
jgi:hypothetical protein